MYVCFAPSLECYLTYQSLMIGLSRHPANAVEFETKAEATAFLSNKLDSKTAQLFEVKSKTAKQRGHHVGKLDKRSSN